MLKNKHPQVCYFAVFVLLLFTLPVYAQSVCRVTDGATFTLCNNTQIHVACIGAPLVRNGKQPTQPMGYPSREFLRELILNKTVTLDCVAQSNGMQTCFSEVDGQDVGLRMVLAGQAYPQTYFPYCGGLYGELLQRANAQAKGQQIGIWSSGTSK